MVEMNQSHCRGSLFRNQVLHGHCNRENWDMFRFLDVYEPHECLWNKSHEKYKDRNARDLAEQDMLSKTNIPSIKLLRAKIRSMRGTYNQEVAKIRQSMKNGNGAQDMYKPKLAWFARAHSFLYKNSEGEEGSKTNLGRDSNLKSEIALNDADDCLAVNIIAETKGNSVINFNSNMNKKRKIEMNGKYFQKESVAMNGLEDSSEIEEFNESSSKDYEVFGCYVTSTLKTLPPENAVAAQHEIMQILSAQKKGRFLEGDAVIVGGDNYSKISELQSEIRDEVLSFQASSLKCKKNANEGCDIQGSSDCSKILCESIMKCDDNAIYGQHIGNKLRNCDRSYIEISIAQHHIEEILFNLTMGRYSPTVSPQGQSTCNTHPISHPAKTNGEINSYSNCFSTCPSSNPHNPFVLTPSSSCMDQVANKSNNTDIDNEEISFKHESQVNY